jgi:hypothetical protein
MVPGVSYQCHYKVTGSSASWIDSGDLGQVGAYTLTGLTASTSYDAAVTGSNVVGPSVKSDTRAVTTAAAPTEAPEKPGLPIISSFTQT